MAQLLYEFAGYTLLQQNLLNKLTLSGGFRLDYNSVAGFEPVPSVGFAYNPTKFTLIKGSISKGFRYPTLRELYMWAPANDSLNAERMVNYEAGISQRFLKDKLIAEVTIFHSVGDNLIKTQMQGGIPRYVNTGNFSNWGMEFSGILDLLENLNFEFNYSYIHMQMPVLATPKHQVFLAGSYTWKRFKFNLSFQSINDLFLEIEPDIDLESYNLLNSRILFHLSKHIEIYFKTENMLNEYYEINKDYSMPGFLGFLGFNFHF